MKKELMFIICLALMLVPMVSAVNIGTSKLGTYAEITNYCASNTCTYANLSSVKYPISGRMVYINEPMTKNGTNFNYTFNNITEIGDYTFVTCSNPDGVEWCESDTFTVSSTGGAGSLTFIIIISALAFIFFIASLFVPEEFFVYISGICFVIGGVYLMINGIDVLNDTNTRYLAIVYLGIGLLFTLGAYIYNLYSDKSEYEEED